MMYDRLTTCQHSYREILEAGDNKVLMVAQEHRYVKNLI